jgi:hypothetical protein
LLIRSVRMMTSPAGRLEGESGGREVEPAGEFEGLARAEFAFHAAVLPLYGEGAGVSGRVELADYRVEVDVAVPEGAEVPAAP